MLFSNISQKILSSSEDNIESFNGLNNNKLSDILSNNCDIQENEMPIGIFNFNENLISISSNNFENDKSLDIIEEKVPYMGRMR